jgi:2-desacetyl-2-hydroxyethyl bacteriochlorophyllide A dehydrogenase
MKGVWLENQRIEYRDDLSDPTPGPGEAVVRVRLAGICGTDLQLLNGYYPFTGIPGHEFVGEVVEAPENPEWRGRRVVGEINVTCGTCRQCRAGRPTHCDTRAVLGLNNHNGAFAEYLTLPMANLHTVPDSVSDAAAVFAEPLAAALQIPEQVHIRPSDAVLVIGAGRLGQLAAQVLQGTACALTVAVRYPAQRALLTARGIAVIDAQDIPARSMDVVVEASGSPAGLEAARRAVRPRGTLVLKSTCAGQSADDLSRLVVDEITLVGSRCGPFPSALRLLAQGRVDPVPLVQKRFTMSDASAAFAAAAAKGALKVVLEG